jgi:RNA recognition motif-containing protein
MEATMNIYVGNLSYEVKEEDLKKEFEAYGQVESVKIIQDTYTGRSKGFGFVEMPNNSEAQAALDGLKGKELKGRALNINEARPKTEGGGGGGARRTGGGGGGARRTGGGGGGGGGRRY